MTARDAPGVGKDTPESDKARDANAGRVEEQLQRTIHYRAQRRDDQPAPRRKRNPALIAALSRIGHALRDTTDGVWIVHHGGRAVSGNVATGNPATPRAAMTGEPLWGLLRYAAGV